MIVRFLFWPSIAGRRDASLDETIAAMLMGGR
jgi:hypothetical protein